MGDDSGPSPAGQSEAAAQIVHSLVSVSAFCKQTAVPRLISQQTVRFRCEYVLLELPSETGVPPRAVLRGTFFAREAQCQHPLVTTLAVRAQPRALPSHI